MDFAAFTVAVGHVLFVNVWTLGQLAGTLGMIARELVLLALGLIDNRFADQIRRWLGHFKKTVATKKHKNLKKRTVFPGKF